MKELYLHIGLHKTGTTLIQNILKNNKKNLIESGINYIDNINGFKDNPCDFLKNNIIDNCTNLISREGLVGFSFINYKGIIEINKLSEICKELNIKVYLLLTLREQVSFIESYYLQLIKEGTLHYDVPFDKFLKNIDIENIDYLELINFYRNFFEVKYLWYELLFTKGTKYFINEFLGLLNKNINLPDINIKKCNMNIGLNKNDLQNFKYKDNTERIKLRSFYQNKNFFEYYKNLFDENEKLRIKKKYSKNNEKLNIIKII